MRFNLSLSSSSLRRSYGGGLLGGGVLGNGRAIMALGIVDSGRRGLGLHEGPPAMGLVEPHDDETDHDADPVQVVRDDGAISGRVGPAQDGVEDAPPVLDGIGRGTALKRVRSGRVKVEEGVSYVDVPDALVNIIRARAIAKLVSLAANVLVPLGHLKGPDGAREETSTDEIQKAGRDDKEELELGARTTPKTVST